MISQLWEKLDLVRWKRLKANIQSWKQIDKQDIKNVLASLVNRRKLSLNSRQIFKRLFCCCFTGGKEDRYDMLFEQGLSRLHRKELDIYRIVQSSRRSKLLSRTLLNQR